MLYVHVLDTYMIIYDITKIFPCQSLPCLGDPYLETELATKALICLRVTFDEWSDRRFRFGKFLGLPGRERSAAVRDRGGPCSSHRS